MEIRQGSLELKAYVRGFHLVTALVENHKHVQNCKKGLLHLLLLHTSASLSLNENADPTVRKDFETFTNVLIPESFPDFVHNYEGSDDMPAHIKSSVYGASLTIPVKDRRCVLGRWQGIYFNEHRTHAMTRNITLSVIGDFFDS